MKNKILTVVVGLLLIFSLVSCDLTFTDPQAPISTVLTDDTTYEKIETNITKTIEEVKSACVGISVTYKTMGQEVMSVGSGVIYKMMDGDKEADENSTVVTCFVITNEHVVNTDGNPAKYNVYLGNGKYIEADSVGSDAANDLAVLTFNVNLKEYNLKAISIDDEEDNMPVEGNYCIAIGCPLSLDNYNYVSVGNIAKVSLTNIMHTAAINPGNSGGALFSITGKLIGINYQKSTIIEEEGEIIPIEGMGYTIPIWTVRRVVSDIESTYKDIERPKLGITVMTVNSTLNPEDSAKLPNTYPNEDEEHKGKDFNQGVVVTAVEEGSNAANATSKDSDVVGLQVNDVVFKVNDTYVTRNTDISRELNLMLKGEEMTIVVLRNVDGSWKYLEYKITLG